jgi:hypothetical protein
MTPHAELTHFAGFDWASDHHDIIIVDATGTLVADFQIEHTAAGWRQWKEKISAYPKLGVAAETSFGMVVEQIIDSAATVYPVNPMSARRYRERKHPSGTKTDRHDAWALADALRTDGHAWRALGPKDPLIEGLRILCRDEVALIEERTALINQLRQALREYYPAALEAFEDWTAAYAWSFIERFPSADALLKAGKRQWEPSLSEIDSTAKRVLPAGRGRSRVKSFCTPTSSPARRPISHGWKPSPKPVSGTSTQAWSKPRASTPWPKPGNCAPCKPSSRSIATALRNSSPATPTAAYLAR